MGGCQNYGPLLGPLLLGAVLYKEQSARTSWEMLAPRVVLALAKTTGSRTLGLFSSFLGCFLRHKLHRALFASRFEKTRALRLCLQDPRIKHLRPHPARKGAFLRFESADKIIDDLGEGRH